MTNSTYKATKKPIEIEYIKFEYSPEGIVRLGEFVGNKLLSCGIDSATIKTLEGNITASDGDYIIKGVKGEFYPCKPDIFKLTYNFTEELSATQQELLELKKEYKQVESTVTDITNSRYYELRKDRENPSIRFNLLNVQYNLAYAYMTMLELRIFIIETEANQRGVE
jgi:hypothetical protein